MAWIAHLLKIFRNVLIGFGIGAVSTAVYLIIALRLRLPVLSTGLMLKELLGSMAFGAYCGIISFVFESGKKNLRKERVALFLFWRTGLHFLLMIIGFMIAGQWLGWFQTGYSFIFWPLFSFLSLYLLIWFFSFLYNRNVAIQLNKGLKKL
ncbi:DUF3021 family protein [Sporolactobacillus pectinivorans]|uniref:DUF3021 family protein n=1 Tax=Sporolactobacillus pectinivorans TaxID=1591408 RepID=UPI0012FE2655|nr:DUF3021 family protein [Sporolactobacillus pectinivorans]